MPSSQRRRRGKRAVATAFAAVIALVLTTIATATTAHAAPQASAPAHPWPGNIANPTGGTDYYIDSVNGSDSNNGTSRSTPWKSLDKVNSTTFRPGDRILLKAGDTWSGQRLWPKGSGAAGRPITIDAYGDDTADKPYIATNGNVPSPFESDGTTKDPDTVGLTGAVSLRNQQYWTIENLQLSNDDNTAVDLVKGNVIRDGVSVSINADKFPAGTPAADTVMHGITVQNLDVHNIDVPDSWQKIYAAGVDFQIFGAKQWTQYPAGGYHFDDTTIRNNRFLHVELNAVQFGFNWWGDDQGQYDSAGKFHEGWEQLWIRTQNMYNHNAYIGHNYAEDIGQGAYQFAGTQHLLAEYNEANGWLQRYDGVSAGLYLWAGADSVMRYNEIYNGPAEQYDATAWDLEYTNFNVTYEDNYSHDNLGGWMSYMGNSGNSIARYNLSVNDNGVIWKNMLSTNYTPTYVTNNVIVYDGSVLTAFHDAQLKSPVYFTNNVFYNTSKTTTTTWQTSAGALAQGVFANNDFYEASGKYSPDQPNGTNSMSADPQFTVSPASYAKTASVNDILRSAGHFTVKSTSPLIGAGKYDPRQGAHDFFGSPVQSHGRTDIGIQSFQH